MKNTLKSLFARIVFIVLYTIIPLIQAAIFISVQPNNGLLAAINYASGVLAYYWILNETVLSLKLPFIQNLLPYHQSARLRLNSNIGILFLFFFHAIHNVAIGLVVDSLAWALLLASSAIFFLPLIWFYPRLLRAVDSFMMNRANGHSFLSGKLARSYRVYGMAAISALMYAHIVRADVLLVSPRLSALTHTGYFWVSIGLVVAAKVYEYAFGSTRFIGHADQEGKTVFLFERQPLRRYRQGQSVALMVAGEKQSIPLVVSSKPNERTLSLSFQEGTAATKLNRLDIGALARIYTTLRNKPNTSQA